MIKNKLYPYIEKYINDYLYGFSKEQLEVGVMNGIINIEKVNIRVDKANEKLDSQNLPIWLKAGFISNIKIACSLMNFIGEKPLDVEIEEVEMLVSPSCRWIIINLNSFIEENEEYINEAYDSNDNNSYDIFTKKLNLFDGSIFKKKGNFLNFLKDKSKLTETIHKLMTKVMRFYYQSNYFVNIKIKKVHIRFEDDIFNFYGGTIFGVTIDSMEISLSAEGKLKKDNIKVTNLNIYSQEVSSIDNFYVSSSFFLGQLNKEGLGSEYYTEIQRIFNDIKAKKIKKEEKRHLILKEFNFLVKFGVQNQDNNLNLFTNAKDKSLKAYFYIASSDLNVSINPNLIGKLTSMKDVFKSYFLNEQIQQYKPMRKPYNYSNDLVKSVINNKKFEYKRKLVVRDWIYYFIMFNKFKKAIYLKPFHNKLQEEFSKYYNICCSDSIFPDSPEKEEKDKDHDDNQSIAASRLSKITMTTISKMTDMKNRQSGKKENQKDEKLLNPDNISLVFNMELNVKSIKVDIYDSQSGFIRKLECINLNFENLKIKSSSNMKDDFHFEVFIDKLSLSNTLNSNKVQVSISNHIENNIISSIHNKIHKQKDILIDQQSIYEIGQVEEVRTPKKRIFEINQKSMNLLNEALTKASGIEKKNILLYNFFEDDENHEEDYKNNNKYELINRIKEYNSKKLKTIKNQMTQKQGLSYEANQQSIYNLDLLEICSIKFNLSKENIDNSTVNDKYSITSDSVRFNFCEFSIKQVLKIFSGYEILVKKSIYDSNKIQKKNIENTNSSLKSIKVSKINSSSQYFLEETISDRILISTNELQNIIINKLQSVYNLSTTIHNLNTNIDLNKQLKQSISKSTSTLNNKLTKESTQLNNISNKQEPSEYIKNYYLHLKSEINSYDKLLLKEGKYEINYLFYILNKKRLEINVSAKSTIIAVFGEDKKIYKLLSKTVSLNNVFKLKILNSKVVSIINDCESEFYEIDLWRKIYDEGLLVYIEKRNVFKIDNIITPFIDIYFENEKIKREVKPKIISSKMKVNLVENEEIDINEYSKNNSGAI